MKLAALFSAALLMIGSAADAQPEMLSPANAARIVEIARLGDGVIRQLAWMRDDRLLVAASTGLWVFDAGGEGAAQFFPLPAGAFSLAVGDSVVAAGGEDGIVYLWNAALTAPPAALEGHLYGVTRAQFSSDETRLVTGDLGGVLRLWSVVDRAESAALAAGKPLPPVETGLALNEDGTRLARVAAAGMLEVHAGDAVRTFGMFTHAVDALRANGNVIYGRYEDGTVRTWSLEGLNENAARVPAILPAFDAARQRFTSTLAAQISPDGRLLARGGSDGVVRISEVVTGAEGREIAAFYGHVRGIRAVAWSPDGVLIASASLDGTIRLWDANAPPEAAALRALTGHTSGVTAVTFSADGRLLISGGFDGTIRVWGTA